LHERAGSTTTWTVTCLSLFKKLNKNQKYIKFLKKLPESGLPFLMGTQLRRVVDNERTRFILIMKSLPNTIPSQPRSSTHCRACEILDL